MYAGALLTDDGDGRAGRDLAVEHAALEARRERVADHDERVLAHALDVARVEARVRVRDADVLGLGAVDRVAEDPAALDAVRRHATAAELARRARRDARDDDEVARLERAHGGPDGLDDADALVPEDAARGARRDVALEDVQVRACETGAEKR